MTAEGARLQKVVTIGGGTGHFVVLSGLKRFDIDLTAVVTMSDSGGSSGRLRDELGGLPPGDLRQCMVALAPDEESGRLLRQLFNYRFKKGEGLEGHSFGNLFLTALEDLCGGMAKAVEEASSLLHIRGRVLPSTLSDSHLHALLKDGTELCTEHAIDDRAESNGVAIEHVFLKPHAVAHAPAVDAICQADIVVLGPGDLYTSVLPTILIEGIGEALRSTSAKRVLVCNLMTKPGETDGFRLSRFLREIYRYAGSGSLDYVLVNTERVSTEAVSYYLEEGSEPVVADLEESRDLVRNVVGRPLLARGNLVRHDPAKLADALMEILEE